MLTMGPAAIAQRLPISTVLYGQGPNSASMNSIISAIADECSNTGRRRSGKKDPSRGSAEKETMASLVGGSKQDVSHSMALAASPCLSLVETGRNEPITSHHD